MDSQFLEFLFDNLKRLLKLFLLQPDEPNRIPCIPYTTYEKAQTQAEERRSRLRAEIDEVGDNGFLRREFLETPPGVQNIERRSFAQNLSEAYGQMARLRWQLDADELLLIERLVDAIVIFIKQEENRSGNYYSDSPEEYPLVKLEPIEAAAQEEELFPWRAIIETDNPEFYIEKLRSIQDWLGIGVDLAPKKRISLLGQCQEPGGLEGVIGGFVEHREQYAMTCAHVLSPICDSVKIRGNPYQGTGQPYNEPDAALIDINTPCFTLPKGRHKKKIFSDATNQIVLNCVNNRSKVFKLNSKSKDTPGLIVNQVAIMPATERGPAYRFPHLEIRPHRLAYLYGLLKLPLGNRYFSREGDSGSWVIEKEMGIWFGMVIAGKDNGITYVAESKPLLDYFQQQIRKMTNSKSVIRLIPFTLS